jgi:hypothetical protein
MDRLIRRRLAKTPLLLSGYLARANRGRRLSGRRSLPSGLSAALVVSVVWMAAVAEYIHTARTTAISTLAWLHRHDLLWTAISLIAAGVLVARRRALNRIAASRSWTAALPIEPSTERWQALVVNCAPALILMSVLVALFGGVCLGTLVEAGVQAPLITWAVMTGGVALGAALGHWLPPPRQEAEYEGSRYVPHRRRAETPIPTASLSALGSWPVRQMFANARPKTLARAMIPALLAVPMGSTAADAMIGIAWLAAIGALALLMGAAISVTAKAARWLKPLPLQSGVLTRKILARTLAFMLCATAFESWLMWLLGSSVARCITLGSLTMVISATFAISGSLLAIRASNKSTHGGH